MERSEEKRLSGEEAEKFGGLIDSAYLVLEQLKGLRLKVESGELKTGGIGGFNNYGRGMFLQVPITKKAALATIDDETHKVRCGITDYIRAFRKRLTATDLDAWK